MKKHLERALIEVYYAVAELRAREPLLAEPTDWDDRRETEILLHAARAALEAALSRGVTTDLPKSRKILA